MAELNLTSDHWRRLRHHARLVIFDSQADAVKYLKKHNYRLDAAVNGLYNDPAALSAITGSVNKTTGQSATKKLGDLFEKYKGALLRTYSVDPSNPIRACSLNLVSLDKDSDNINVEGTMDFCHDVGLDLEDAVTLAVSHELQSKTMGEFSRAGWLEGWKNLKCDSLESMRNALPSLRSRLSSDPAYFKTIYLYAFDFAKAPGQRSIPVDNAKAFWGMLLPVGLEGDALTRESGWKPEYNDWWFEFLDTSRIKGISKDVWKMVSTESSTLWRTSGRLSGSSLGLVSRIRNFDRHPV